MARYTSAYSSFIGRLVEVEILRRFASEKELYNPVNLRYEINALCRGAIVLLSGHLEAFIKEIGEIALDAIHHKSVHRSKLASRIFYHISKDIIDEIQVTSDPDKIAEKIFFLFGSEQPFWSRIGPFPEQIPIDRFNKGFSNPAHGKIRLYFNRFGYSDFNYDLTRKLKAHYQPTINMVDHLVDTRNKIAHGDPIASKTPSDVKDMVAIIRRYCMATDSVFADWCKYHFCSIR